MNGNDGNNGTNFSSAFETIGQASSLVIPSDTIFLIGEFSNPSYVGSFNYTNECDPRLWHAENC